jgi:serine O-acetyltransferase
MIDSTDPCRERQHHRLRVVRAHVSADIGRYLNKSPENRAVGDRFKTRLSAFLSPPLLCLTAHRIAHWLYANHWRRLARLLTRLNFHLHKVMITPDSCIGPGCWLPHPAGVSFCGTAGAGLTLYSLACCGPRDCLPDLAADAGPRIGDRVTIGGHAVVTGAVAVGDDVKVAFRACVSRDVPARVIVSSRSVRAFPVRRGRLGEECNQ